MEAAAGVFTRFGFRKASMDEVARAAGVSRQGLYLHFATKEALFQATLDHVVSVAMDSAERALSDGSAPLSDRLVSAFDAWMGMFAGMTGANASELTAAGQALSGPVMEEQESRFVAAVARAMRASGLAAAYRPAGLTAPRLAATLYATARGLKYASPTRAAFVASMTDAVKALCLPLRGDS